MPTQYSNFINVEEHQVEIFEYLWVTLTPELPEIQSSVQDSENQKAAVFNNWVNYIAPNQYVLLKTERQVLHAYDETLLQLVKTHFSQNKLLMILFEQNQNNLIFYFKFSYFLTLEVFIHLNEFVENHPFLNDKNLITIPYYYLTDTDIDPNDQIYVFMKYFNSEFLLCYLNKQKLLKMSDSIFNSLLEYTF